MLFHVHNGKYEVFSITAMPGTLGGSEGASMSIAYTPLGFCEPDNIIRPLASTMGGDCCTMLWSRGVLRKLRVPLDHGTNRLWWCYLRSDHPLWVDRSAVFLC